MQIHLYAQDISRALPGGSKTLDKVEGAITFSEVCFSYPKRPDALVLKSVSVTIPAGCTTAFVGSSGSGKIFSCRSCSCTASMLYRKNQRNPTEWKECPGTANGERESWRAHGTCQTLFIRWLRANMAGVLTCFKVCFVSHLAGRH